MELREIKAELRNLEEEKRGLYEHIDALRALLAEKEVVERTRQRKKQLKAKLNGN